MSKTSVLKVVQLQWLLLTSKFLWHTFKLSIVKTAKTDMRNIKYTLELFICLAGNICKKKWYEKREIQKQREIKNIKK